MTLPKWFWGTVSILALIGLVGTLAIGNAGIPLAQVPAEILPPAIQRDVQLIQQAKNLPTGPTLNPNLLSGNATPAELKAGITQFIPSILPFAFVQPYYTQTFNQLAVEVQRGVTTEPAALSPDLSLTQWGEIGLAFAVIGVVACAVLTAGLCLLTIVILVTALVLLSFFITQLSEAASNDIGLATNYLGGFANYTNGLATISFTALSAVSSSEGTYAALAEEAALAQLGSAWNPTLDLLNSTLAQGFAGFEASLFSAETVAVQNLMNQFDNTFLNQAGVGCGITFGYGGAYPSNGAAFTTPYNPSGPSTCGTSASFTKQVANGLEDVQSWDVPECSGTPSLATSTAALYISDNGTTVSAGGETVVTPNPPYAIWGDAHTNIQIYSLSGTLLGSTVDATANGAEGNWTLPRSVQPEGNAFLLCGTGANDVIGLAASFPINAATEEGNLNGGSQSNPEQIASFGNDPSIGAGFAVVTASTMGYVATEDSGVGCVSIYGNETSYGVFSATTDPSYCAPNNDLSNLTAELYAEAAVAVKFGEAWWAFLTYLGYSNANQVPNACLILTPSSLMPATIPWTALEFMSVFQILMVFTDTLAIEDTTFANTAPPSGSFTFCGLTAQIIDCQDGLTGALNVTLRQELLGNISPNDPYGIPYDSQWWQCSYGMASEGIGYLYNGSGTFGNSLADARTWGTNDGLLTILGSLHGIGPIPINETWEIPARAVNPTSIDISYLQNKTSFEADPEICLQTNPESASNISNVGCNVNTYPDELGVVVGNSSLVNGSAIDTHVRAGVGAAVYLVGCLSVAGSSTIFNVSVTTQQSGDCNFTGFNWTWGNQTCLTNPNSSLCHTGCNPLTQDCCKSNCPGSNFCLTFPIIDVFTSELGNWFGSWSGGALTGLGQGIGCVLGILVLGIVVVFFAWLALTLVRSSRRNSG